MKINILTLFPEMFTPLSESMLGRAAESGILEFNIIDIRGFSQNKHKKADDYTFGGGQGMVLMPQPVFDAMRSIEEANGGSTEEAGKRGGIRNIYMSPRGRILNKELALNLADEKEITILAGHYEGVDERILEAWDFEEISIGDYILTGGELAAMVLIDSFARFIPGVLSTEESAHDESIYSGLLEYPQYTQPREFEGIKVPDILLSGNHRAIYLWRLEESLRLTREKRPDLFEEFVKNAEKLAKDERKVLEKFID